MKKALSVFLVALLVFGFAISCKPEPKQTSMKSVESINSEIEEMDAKDAKNITTEQKEVVESVLTDMMTTLESLAQMFNGTKKGLEEPVTTGTLSATITTPITITDEGVSHTLSDLVLSVDLETEDLTISYKMDGNAEDSITEEMLEDVGEAILKDLDKLEATVELKDFTNTDEDGQVTTISATVVFDKGTFSLKEPAVFSVKDGKDTIDVTVTASAIVGVTEAKDVQTISISSVNVTISATANVENNRVTGEFALKDGTLSVAVDEEEGIQDATLSLDELSAEVTINGIKAKAIVKGVEVDVEKGTVSVEYADVSANVPTLMQIYARISDVAITDLNEDAVFPPFTGSALASISTKSGYIAVKATMGKLGLNGVADVNGSAVSLESFLKALEEIDLEF